MIIKKIIETNKNACDNIVALEHAVAEFEIKNEKDKANFGNLCVALRGFRMVADATEALLANEWVLKGEDGNFYKKIEEEIPTTAKGPCRDFDVDKNITEDKDA